MICWFIYHWIHRKEIRHIFISIKLVWFVLSWLKWLWIEHFWILDKARAYHDVTLGSRKMCPQISAVLWNKWLFDKSKNTCSLQPYIELAFKMTLLQVITVSVPVATAQWRLWHLNWICISSLAIYTFSLHVIETPILSIGLLGPEPQPERLANFYLFLRSFLDI